MTDVSIAVTVVSADVILLIAFLYGTVNFFGKKAPMYFRFLTCGIGCYLLSELLWTAYYFCYDELPDSVGLFSFGYFGCYLFLLSMNYGPVDSMVDDGAKQWRKYRLIALAAPIVSLAALVPFFLWETHLSAGEILLMLLLNSPKWAASYYNLKHLIFPDTGYGFIRGMRLGNLLMLVIYAIDTVLVYVTAREMILWEEIFSVAIPACLLALVFSAKRGYRKWSI